MLKQFFFRDLQHVECHNNVVKVRLANNVKLFSHVLAMIIKACLSHMLPGDSGTDSQIELMYVHSYFGAYVGNSAFPRMNVCHDVTFTSLNTGEITTSPSWMHLAVNPSRRCCFCCAFPSCYKLLYNTVYRLCRLLTG